MRRNKRRFDRIFHSRLWQDLYWAESLAVHGDDREIYYSTDSYLAAGRRRHRRAVQYANETCGRLA
jgi:hypothetical protein